MFYKNYIFVVIFFLMSNCTTSDYNINKSNKIFKNAFSNQGFTLTYDDNLYSEKIISNKIDERSLIIFQKNLKKNTQVKITNMINNKSLIARIGKNTTYPLFYNSVISKRISQELDIDIEEPYIEIIAIPENSLFVAKRAKTFDEEKKVANKVPVKAINVDNLNIKKINLKKNNNKKFSYFIKIADFYFKDTALAMNNRIVTETNFKKPKIKKISDRIYRVYLGPFDNINSLKNSFNDIKILDFENIEIIRND
tara:strand:+ start:92 stop:850 length:759 start_codon:yes stop_codon:yes gene_type:complete